jgi:hypothetical protein
MIDMPLERHDGMKMKKWTHFLQIADTTKALKALKIYLFQASVL